MQSPAMQKVYVILVSLILLGFFGYTVFVKSNDPESLNLANTEIVGQDIISLVEKLNSISTDKTIFGSVIFTSLQDTSAVILPESYGRLNPFAPIGVESSI